ncbi:MAG: monovalent cation/H+ antiporter subunit D family protein [Planctomycetota bacterium]|nr:monovalent cation/H+ antiporter subunit D family protein [Planctomycetota bacterium]
MIQQAPALLVVIPLIAAFLTPLIGWWKKHLCYYWVCFALTVSFILSVLTLSSVISQGVIRYNFGSWLPPWGIEYVVDYLNGFMAVLISLISLLVVIYSKNSVRRELPTRIVYFYTVALLLIIGLLGIIVTGDMFNLYVFTEISALAAYALIAVGDRKSPVASFNYLVMGTVGTCFYLLAVGYLYMATGTLNMADLAQRLPDIYHSRVVLVGLGFLLVGLSLKMGLFPLHLWLPDAYTHAPSVVSGLIASTMTKVSAYVLIRVLFTVFKPDFVSGLIPVTQLLSWLAAGAIIFGSIWAIAQYDLKRMLAYSSVAQIGYIVLGIGLVNRLALTGSLLHILSHTLMKGCLFLIAGAIIYRTGTRDIRQFRRLNLRRHMSLTLIAFIIASLSMVGIPPTCGFFSKWYLILGALDKQEGGGWFFAVVLLVGSLLSAVYFFKVIEQLWFVEPEGSSLDPSTRTGAGQTTNNQIKEAPLSMLIPIGIMVLGILAAGIFSGQIISRVLELALPAGL